MDEYVVGTALKDDEYLLKVRADRVGFLTKLNKDGSIPKAFSEWGKTYVYGKNYGDPGGISGMPDIKIHKETFKSGWALRGWRFGQSQNWAILLHPDGFSVEVYLDKMLTIFQRSIIDHGNIIGEFKWEKYKLIKK